MNPLERLIAAGVYDRLVNVLGQLRGPTGVPITGQIGPSSASFTNTVNRLWQELGLAGRANRDAYNALTDEARKAVNAARRWNSNPNADDLPPLRNLPCPENPDGRCTDRIEVTGFIDVTDPVSGVTSRVPFVVSSSEPISRTEVASRAAAAALADVSERGYDKGGRINPERATTGTVVITSITGRG